MADFVIRLSPDPRHAHKLVRGAWLEHATPPTHVACVYDFIDCIGFRDEDKQSKKRKRGPFARETWARMTYVCANRPSLSAPFAAALRAVAVDAPMRASAKVARWTHMPCVPLSYLRMFMQAVIADLKNTNRYSESRLHEAARQAIDGISVGEQCMFGTLLEPSGKRKRVRREDAVDELPEAKKPALSDAANSGETHVLLRLTNGAVVRGTTMRHGDAPVFAVYDFLDVVGSQLSEKPKSRMWARHFWKRLITWKYKHDFCNDTPSLAVRCNAHSGRTHVTPVLPMERLHLVLNFVYTESLKQDGPGIRNTKPRTAMERKTRQELEDIFGKYFKGDRSMIEICE